MHQRESYDYVLLEPKMKLLLSCSRFHGFETTRKARSGVIFYFLPYVDVLLVLAQTLFDLNYDLYCSRALLHVLHTRSRNL